ncbi:MAG: GntR family transcriptional regulator [Alphaproteobacteria bacterium]|nr:GntR family transcriptional regulator [Alphaproteobacteria bacterium]
MTNNVLNIRPITENFSLKARIYDELKAAITTMNIYDEDAELRLDERGLSQQFGISRTPLREALVRLDQEGLVRIEPRRGIFIVRKSKQEILDMITVWAALESMAARLITSEASDEEIATLRRMLSVYDRERVTQHIDEYSETNISFHQAIISLGKCALLAEITDPLFMHVRAIRARTIFEEDRARRSIEDHLAIVEALEARDTEQAERLVREHTLKLRDHVARHVELD